MIIIIQNQLNEDKLFYTLNSGTIDDKIYVESAWITLAHPDIRKTLKFLKI